MPHSVTSLLSFQRSNGLLLSGGLLAGMLWVAPVAHAQGVSAPRPGMKASAPLFAAPIALKVGQSLFFPLPKTSAFSIEEGANSISAQSREENLQIKALAVGESRLIIRQPGQKDRVIALSIGEGKTNPLFAKAPAAPTLTQRFTLSRSSGQLLPPENGTTATNNELPAYLRTLPAPTIAVPGLATPTPVAPVPVATVTPTPTVETSPPTLPTLEPVTGVGAAPTDLGTSGTTDIGVPSGTPAGGSSGTQELTTGAVQQPTPPTLVTPANESPSAPRPGVATPRPRISPVLATPPSVRNARPAKVSYKTTPRLPRNVNANGARQSVQVSQGLARLITFPDNILSVFFSDPSVMDARAINARTIAVTGVGSGQSTLAVFTARTPTDAIGKANIYRIQTVGKGGGAVGGFLNLRDPKVVQSAITTALGDPRIRVFVTKLPDGNNLVRLSGTVRNPAEVEGAITVASFYAPRVVSSLYADTNSPTIDAVLTGSVNPSAEAGLQDNLRRITGNSSIELVPLPTGLAFKAEVDSEADAEALLRVLPSLNQQVIPFIVVRGASASSNETYYNSTVPMLQGEDLQLTQRLQSVTGVRTVYAVRTSGTSVAIYGNVRTRADYDAVRRFSYVVAQSSTPVASAGATQGGSALQPLNTTQSLGSYDPVGGYRKPVGVQLYVRILDPVEATIRNVAVETSIVEVSRNALRNLGVEYGSVALTGERVTGGTTTTTTNGVTNTTSTPVIVERTIDPAFRQGTISAGNGLIGGGPTQFLDPIRANFNALAQRGDARILSRPTIRAVEGATAQITIGGERPVPSSSGGANSGVIGQSIEFRRFGVIITMRPTVTDDDTIILQIRADVTQPDRTFEINLNGALIPGESVRSIDTTLTIRPGDTVVMGGLMTNDKRQRTSKVPILGDLPILGALFQSKRFENNETELAIFMTPRIEAIGATPGAIEAAKSVPGFPALPSRQESNEILSGDRTRTAE